LYKVASDNSHAGESQKHERRGVGGKPIREGKGYISKGVKRGSVGVKDRDTSRKL